MAVLRSALRRRRFELFHVSLVICGVVIAADPLWTLSTGSTDSLVFSTLGVVVGVSFVVWGIREGWRRDREDWATEFEGFGLAIWLVIGSALFFVVGGVYAILSAL